MAAKEEKDHEDQNVGHVAFRIPDFWPHGPTTWFRKIESKFRICNIRQSSTKYDHLLSALPTDICSSINDSLTEIDENAEDAYEQLKALLTSWYTMDGWARAFELHKFPEIGDMKPSEMMRQMKALLPPDSTAGTYFMATFLLRLPADMIDHIISQDFKDCNKMAEYADKLYARRRGNAVAAVNANQDSAISAVSGGRRRESSPHDRRRRSPSRQGRSRAVQRRQRHLLLPHHLRRTGEGAILVASGSRETGRPPRTKYSRRRHDFFTG
jgi:hypothetical protein